MAHMRPSLTNPGTNGIFKANYDGVCGCCGFSFEAGEMVHYVKQKVCHESCHELDGSGESTVDDMDYEDRVIARDSYIRKGRKKRNPPVCTECHIEHPPGTECP